MNDEEEDVSYCSVRGDVYGHVQYSNFDNVRYYGQPDPFEEGQYEG